MRRYIGDSQTESGPATERERRIPRSTKSVRVRRLEGAHRGVEPRARPHLFALIGIALVDDRLLESRIDFLRLVVLVLRGGSDLLVEIGFQAELIVVGG